MKEISNYHEKSERGIELRNKLTEDSEKKFEEKCLDLLQWELRWKHENFMNIPFGVLARHGHKLA